MLSLIIFWTILIGLIGVGGAYFSLRIFSRFPGRLLFVVSFAAGALVGVSFLELLPEALEAAGEKSEQILPVALLGFVFFYMMARFLNWHHCHDEKCAAKTSASLIIFGDTAHNFLDGLAVAASFLAGFPAGFLTFLAIVFHEVPQEVGDFGILLHSGWSRRGALLVNGLQALAAVLAGVLGFYFLESFKSALPYLLAVTAGNFLYLGASDLLPQTHLAGQRRAIFSHALLFLSGIAILWVLGLVIHE